MLHDNSLIEETKCHDVQIAHRRVVMVSACAYTQTGLGPVKIPVAFRLWQPRAKCRPQCYRTKLLLAQQKISEMLMVGLPFDYLVFDSWYNERWFARCETIFRGSKQFTGFAVCQCHLPQAMARHVAFVLLTHVVLNQLKLDSSETVGEVKEQLQHHVVSGNASPPVPLKARVA